MTNLFYGLGLFRVEEEASLPTEKGRHFFLKLVKHQVSEETSCGSLQDNLKANKFFRKETQVSNNGNGSKKRIKH